MQQSGPRQRHWLAAWGGLYAAIAVGLAAYAAHIATGPDQAHLQLAAVIAFGHGIALAALAPQQQRRLTRVALWALWLGVLLFSGSLAGNALARWPVTLAPFGGSLLIGAWLVYSIDQLRH